VGEKRETGDESGRARRGVIRRAARSARSARLHARKCIRSHFPVERDNIVQAPVTQASETKSEKKGPPQMAHAHELEERARVHALRARKVGAGLFERVHRGADAVHGSDGGHEGEDWQGVVSMRGDTRWRHALIIFAPISSASLIVNDGVRPPEMTLTSTYTAPASAQPSPRTPAAHSPAPA
jgi:hypothetical protein